MWQKLTGVREHERLRRVTNILTSFFNEWRNLSKSVAVYRWQGGKFIKLRLKCDGTRAETRFRLSAKRTSPFKSAGASVHSTMGSRGVRISFSNAGYTIFRGSVKSTGYPLHSLVSPSLPLPCVTVYHHISTGLYLHNAREVRRCLDTGNPAPRSFSFNIR